MGRRKVLHSYLILFAPSIDSKQKKAAKRLAKAAAGENS